jgi:hypothetical protein
MLISLAVVRNLHRKPPSLHVNSDGALEPTELSAVVQRGCTSVVIAQQIRCVDVTIYEP